MVDFLLYDICPTDISVILNFDDILFLCIPIFQFHLLHALTLDLIHQLLFYQMIFLNIR